MENLLQIAGLLVLLVVGVRVLLDLVWSLKRSRLDEERRRLSLEVFRERARLDLMAARAERARSQETWSGWRKFEVVEKVEEAHDIVSFYFEPHDRQSLAPFLPGQHLKFRVRIPGESAPLVRCYSLSDGPGNLDRYRITVKRATPSSRDHPPGRVSSFLIDRIEVGDLLDVGAPSGHFFLDPASQRPLVLIGGGVGLTPLVSMLSHLDDDPWVRDVYVFYGARNREEHPLKEYLEMLAAKHQRLKIVTVYSRPTASCRKGVDFEQDGYVTRALLSHYLPSNQFEYFVCGPPAMMADLVPALGDWGVPKEDIHFEAFGPSSIRRAKSALPDAVPTEVVFARSDRRVMWEGEGSLLDLAMENDVAIDFGCAAGSCGSCQTAIKKGQVRYMTEPGEPPEEGSCLPCVAIPDGPLVLDA